MKRFFCWLKNKIVTFIKWIWNECKDPWTLMLLGLVILVVYSPVWVGYILFWIFRWKWALISATAILAFWAGPFSPFFPLCISITLGIKKAFKKLRCKKKAK